MKVVNINDIEDLILAKHDIDVLLNEHGELEGRSDLVEFTNKVAIPDYVYLTEDKQIPFGFVEVYGSSFLFIVNDDEGEINIIKNKLKLLKYNLSNLVEIPRLELATKLDMSNVIIHDSKYYM